MLGTINHNNFYNIFASVNSYKKYVFGINQYSDCVASQISIDGYIDDFSHEKSRHGLPVLKLAEIDNASYVLSCISSIYLNSAQQKLESLGFKNIGHYIELADIKNGLFKQVEQITNSRQSYAAHQNSFLWLKSILADQESLRIYEKILDFRVNGNIHAMSGFTNKVLEQYFPEFLVLQDGEVFVDGGGFDGQTSIEFMARCPKYRSVHIFEPGKKSYENILISLANKPNLHFYNQGLYDSIGFIGFDSSGGSHSQIVLDSSADFEKIQITTLDQAVTSSVSFIKLDIEGAELNALHGMRGHILEDHPNLAIAVYHQANDFWKIPEYVLGIRNDYKVYLRHYTEGWSETVMYFIPA